MVKKISIPLDGEETTYPAIVGQVLVNERKTRGLDQAAMADAVGVNQSTWSRVERGESAMTLDQLSKAAAALNARPSTILASADKAADALVRQRINVRPERPKQGDDAAMTLIAVAVLGLLVASILSK